MAKEKVTLISLANNNGCFDLQFRKDTRHERTNSPTYYRWKAQFVVTAPKGEIKNLEKIKKEIKCGKITESKNQARFSVQKIDDIIDFVVPYFEGNQLLGEKKKDFKLWAKAVKIIFKYKGKPLLSWKKNDLNSLIEIQKSSAKYKSHSKTLKWLQIAKSVAQ